MPSLKKNNLKNYSEEEYAKLCEKIIKKTGEELEFVNFEFLPKENNRQIHSRNWRLQHPLLENKTKNP